MVNGEMYHVLLKKKFFRFSHLGINTGRVRIW